MVIYIGSDHRGFELKEYLKSALGRRGYTVVDMGNAVYDESDDYTDIAAALAKKVGTNRETSKGILLCGSGVGVAVVANKFPSVRAALVATPDQAFDSRNDDDANILCFGANYLDAALAEKIAVTWLATPFSKEPRYARRLEELSQLEAEACRAPKEE
ncbi:MAG: RpiB/LacA/LacB family sugar-phosphate isomerase [Candidatus Jorgensenbacteria bacterium]|nr:RpiB/LacA/LacB family sugar-phosphate isomerase [Candidatus Jorgensenbacteria bacterium]